MKRLTLGFILLLLVLSLFGCNKKEETIAVQPDEPTKDTVETPEEIVELPEPEENLEEPKEEIFKNKFPLTGLGTNDEVDYRVFGVMIENSKSARPQSGLYKADLVYEILSEGTITRLLSFYHSEKPDIIGPVRSARDYYINLNNGYNGIYVSAGGSPQAFAMFQSGKVDHISGLSYDGRYFSRSSARKAPHNLYTSYENLVKSAEHAKHSLVEPPPPLPFSEKDVSLIGEKAEEIKINYGSSINNVEYKYDEKEKKYIRIVGGTQSVDLETEVPVLIDNLFIVEMQHKIIDNVGRRSVNITSGGNGILIQNGVYQAVQWENVNGQILPKKDGEILSFLQGKTWINVVPNLDQNASIIN